jgi:hypothetical protein
MPVALADLIQILLLAAVVAQLVFNRRAMLADHERRKKQATFEYVNAVAERFRSALNEFDSKHGPKKVVDISDYDEEDRLMVKAFLNEIEYICAGVNAGVFDLDILNKMMGTSLKSRHHRFNQYIENARKDRATVFIEYSEVVRKLSLMEPVSYSNIGEITSS